MKLKNLINVCIFYLFISCSEKPKTQDLESVVGDLYSDKSSINYEIDYKIKIFDADEDTIRVKARTILIKDKKDSLFGGYVWYKIQDSVQNFEKYYDLNNLYYIDHSKQEIIEYDLENEQPFLITSAFDGQIIRTYFLNSEKLDKLITDTIYQSTVLNKDPFYHLNVEYPDNLPLQNRTRDIFINSSSKEIEKIKFYAEFEDQTQYNEWNLSNITFDVDTKEDLEKRFSQYNKKYTLRKFKRKSQKETAALSENTPAPDFKGLYFSKENKNFSLSDFPDKILIFDFWYMACYPCLKAIPQMNNINHKYKDKDVVVIGLNPYDNKSSYSSEQIQEFLEKKNMKYPIVFVDSTVTSKYNINAFPTLYVLNKNRSIIYSKIGYSESTEKELDSILDNALK